MEPLGRVEALREAFFHHQDCLLQVWKQKRKLRYGYALLSMALLCLVGCEVGTTATYRAFAVTADGVLLACIFLYIVAAKSGLQTAQRATRIAWDKYMQSGET
jgi:hypothetical protein